MANLNVKLPSVKPLKDLQAYMTLYGEQEAAPLYVLNQTDERASILLTCTLDKGDSSSVLLPYSIAPFDITTVIQRSVLLSSPDFKKALANGYLRIIDNASAEAALKHPIIRQAAEKLHSTNQVKTRAGKAGDDSDIQLATFATTMSQQAEDMSNYHPAVVQLMGFDEEEARTNFAQMQNILFNALGDLTDADVEYMRKNSKVSALTDLLLSVIDE
jgi:hypothetical protein